MEVEVLPYPFSTNGAPLASCKPNNILTGRGIIDDNRQYPFLQLLQCLLGHDHGFGTGLSTAIDFHCILLLKFSGFLKKSEIFSQVSVEQFFQVSFLF